MTTVLIIGALLIALNVWATRRVLRSEESSHRKNMLVAGIWIMPFVGALFARDYATSAPATAAQGPLPDGFRSEPPPQEIRLRDDSSFSIIDNVGAVNGVPILDWKALDAWASSLGDETKASEGKNLARRAWLLHLREAVGQHFHIYESEQAYVLSSLEPHVAVATAEYVATTRRRIGMVLKGVAQFPLNEKAVLLIFDDDASYYHYVSTYHPKDGEFALSGGMFINFGCPHFVAKRADLAMVEPVIAHEMSHMAVSYLRLPTWLDEGIAVNLERRLTGVRGVPIDTPQELHAKHARFWNDERIQEFWSGASFHRMDEGNLLSYELGRILVEHLSRDWPRFAKFVSAADRADAGVAAARELLSVDLGASVCALLEVESTHDWSPERLAAKVERPGLGAE